MIFTCVAISLVYTVIAAIEPGCENCGCCVDGVCAPTFHQDQGYTVPDYCTHGCIDGYGGNRCYWKCADDCVTCDQTYREKCATCIEGEYVNSVKRCVNCPTRCKTCTSSTNCQECEARYYNSGSTGRCSDTCPVNCKSCTSVTQCQECNPPYYNAGDVTNCSLSCPGNCMCSAPGICSSCKDGYYNIQNECQDKCPDKCKICSDSDTCQSCMGGYHNGQEYDNENNDEVTDCSLSCRGNCIRCNSYNQCIQCQDGFAVPTCTECVAGRYGESCDKICPSTCKDSECKRDTGHCYECNYVNITGDECDQCVAGTWDNTCSTVCPSRCFSGQCIRETGFCESCEGNFDGKRCDQCIDGYHGSECDKECPKNCQESYCVRDTGFCQSCKAEYTGQTCDECSDGRYGESCEFLCISTECHNNICNRFDGKCLSCPSGLYGSLCELNCSHGCGDGSCDFQTGSCFECSNSYSGDKCCIQNGHCRNCSSNSLCETCSGGYYGEKCNMPCPAMCTNGREKMACGRTTGICTVCGDGFYGDFCTLVCNSQCLNSRCLKDNGHCSEGCVHGYGGPKCTEFSNNLSTIGTAVGISSAITVVIATILVVVLCIILRRWFRKEPDTLKEHLVPTIQTSYMNTEFQQMPAEAVEPNYVEDLSGMQEYEELNEGNLPKSTDYDQIK